jgi:hypothetical protein
MSGEVTANELESIVYNKRLDCLIGQFGKGYNRSIDYLVGTGEYVVMDHHETVWNGRDAGQALEAYYNIPRQ